MQKNTKYSLSAIYNLFHPVDLNEYYSREIDEREILDGYNFDLIPEILSKTSLFTFVEIDKLNIAQAKFTQNIAQLSTAEYERDMERLAIDLSWKSSQIEGNKRVARIVANAVFMANRYCPLSFRTVDSVDYKKAMLLFYEQNNIFTFKKNFIEQFE